MPSVYNIGKNIQLRKHTLRLRITKRMLIPIRKKNKYYFIYGNNINNNVYIYSKLEYDIMEYRLSNYNGDLFFDLKEYNEEQYLEIIQSKNIGSGNFRREKIFIDRAELLQFRDAINKAVEYWFPEAKKEKTSEKQYTLEEKRQEYGNAYLPWEKEADEYLIRLYEEGKSIKELTEIFERNNGAIRSRLKKLGKIK